MREPTSSPASAGLFSRPSIGRFSVALLALAPHERIVSNVRCRIAIVFALCFFAAGCTDNGTGQMITSRAVLTGTVVRAPTGMLIPGVTVGVAVFADPSCDGVPLRSASSPPRTDSVGKFETVLTLHDYANSNRCVVVSALGATVAVAPVHFRETRPFATVDVKFEIPGNGSLHVQDQASPLGFESAENLVVDTAKLVAMLEYNPQTHRRPSLPPLDLATRAALTNRINR